MTSDDSYYDKLIRRIKDNKVVAVGLLVILIFSGGVALLSQIDEIIDLVSESKPSEAEIILSQFTINSDDSYYVVDKIVDASQPIPTVSCCADRYFHLQKAGVRQESITTFVQTEKGRILGDIFYRLLNGQTLDTAIEWAVDRLRTHEEIDKEHPTKDNIRRIFFDASSESPIDPQIFTGVFPVFDLSFLNKSNIPAILTSMKVDGYTFREEGGAEFPEGTVKPLSVTHRYIVDLAQYRVHSEDRIRVDSEEGSGSVTFKDGPHVWTASPQIEINSDLIDLTPPIKIAEKEALRIQIQLLDTDLDPNNQQYFVRLTFTFSNGNTVSTEFISFTTGLFF